MGQAKVETKWAKGLQQQGKGWSIGFQIKGKRQSMTVYCSQAEASVVYDLAAIWANKQKGNNPSNSTYYNFSILWYPHDYVDKMVTLPDFPSVKEYTGQLLADGTAQHLVPFDGVARMHRVQPNDTWKTHRALELGVNSRGIHFFSGSFWNCVLMEDVESFGADGRSLQLTYRGHVNILADRARQNALATYHYKSDEAQEIYCELQRAVAAMEEQGFAHVPRDLGQSIDPQPDSADNSETEERAAGTTRRRAAAAVAQYTDLLAAESEDERLGEGEEEDKEPPTPPAKRGAGGGSASRGRRGGRGGSDRGGARGSDSWGPSRGGGAARRRGDWAGAAPDSPEAFDDEEEDYMREEEEEQYEEDGEGDEGAEGPSKDELDLFRDFASIAAGAGAAPRRPDMPVAAPAPRHVGGARNVGELLATAPARLPPAGRGPLLSGGRKRRRALSEPVEPLAHPAARSPPPYPPPGVGSVPPVEADSAPLFHHIPRRKRTDSFMRSTTRAGGDASTVSPMQQQGSSDHRAATATASLQTSHRRTQHTAQSPDLRRRRHGSGGVWETLQETDQETMEEEPAEGEGEGGAPSSPAAAGSGGDSAGARPGLKQEQKIFAEQGASAERESVQGEQQQSSGQQAGAAASSAPPPSQSLVQQQEQQQPASQQRSQQQQQASQHPRQRAPKHSRREMAELVQLSGFHMASLQQPFMSMMPAGMMGSRPLMAGAGMPFFPVMAAPQQQMAAAAAAAGSGGPAAGAAGEQGAAMVGKGAAAAAAAVAPQAGAGFAMMRGMPAMPMGMGMGMAGMGMPMGMAMPAGMMPMPMHPGAMMIHPAAAGMMPMVQVNPMAMAMMQSAMQSGGSTKA